jgi:hypothetical protein
MGELGDDHDQQRQRSRGRANRIDRPFQSTSGVGAPMPVQHHPELGHGEREQGAHGKQRNQVIGNATEYDQQQR